MEQSRFHKLSTDETTEKTTKCHAGSAKKAANFGSKLLNSTLKFPYRFKEIISLIETEEQSGRPIQCQIPQSQQRKAKTVPVGNNFSTASFPFDFSFN